MDVSTTRIVIVVLGCLCGLCVVGTVVLSALGAQPSPALDHLAIVAAGVIAGIPINTHPPTEPNPASPGSSSGTH